MTLEIKEETVYSARDAATETKMALKEGWNFVADFYEKDCEHILIFSRRTLRFTRAAPTPTEIQQPPRKSVYKMLKNQGLSATMVEVILADFEHLGLTFPDTEALKNPNALAVIGRDEPVAAKANMRHKCGRELEDDPGDVHFVEPSEIPDGEAD